LKSTEQAVVFESPELIRRFQLANLRGRLYLHMKGLKSRGASAIQATVRLLNLPREARHTAEDCLARVQAELDKYKDAQTGLNKCPHCDRPVKPEQRRLRVDHNEWAHTDCVRNAEIGE
jgi:hypothetical protein